MKRKENIKISHKRKENHYSIVTVTPELVALQSLSSLPHFCALNIYIHRLINDVGPKIKADNVDFHEGPIIVFVPT